MSESDKEVVDRDTQGRFVKGKSGNPAGRPVGTRNKINRLKGELELAIREGLRPGEIRSIVASMVAEAQAGNVAAAKLILDKVMSNARGEDEGEERGNTFKVVIENLTVDHGNIIEGEVIEPEDTQ